MQSARSPRYSRNLVRPFLAGAMTALLAVMMIATLAAAQLTFSPEAEAMRSAARQAGVPEVELPLRTPAEIRTWKAEQPTWQAKVTSAVRERLTILEGEDLIAPDRRYLAPAMSTEIVAIDDQARLRVELQVDNDALFDEGFFSSIGGELILRTEGFGYVVGWVPAEQIANIAARDDVRLILPIQPLYPDIGSQNSEGDAVHRADVARAMLGVDGTGQMVGAISDGVTSIAVSQALGDLPAGVDVQCAGSGDEGTAMLEIIHDLAPAADLAFCTGFPGTAGMIAAIVGLASTPGMTVITDDLPFPGEPLFEDGPIAQAKQLAVAGGVFYTGSAGNRGNQHYENNFNNTATNVTIGPNTYDAPHDFGGADHRLQVSLGNPNNGSTSNSLYLQWADPFGASAIDLDLYVVDNAGNVLGSSTNTQNGSQSPNEVVSFNAPIGTVAHIIVDYVSGGSAPNVFFDLRGFAGMQGWEYLIRAGSINGASRQAEVYAAGAAFQGTPGTIQGFSSRGPIRHFFPAQLTRMKPDGVGVDGVSVTGAGGFGSGTCPAVNPGDCQFFGTSAATPHVAALAALLLEAQPALTPGQVAGVFNTTAVDMAAAGPDNDTGFGRLDVFEAICSFDGTPPDITCPDDITVECSTGGGTPANDPQLGVFFGGVSATDICTPNPTITDDAPAFFAVGTTTSVTFTATDDEGNQSSCSADVTVEDTTPPDVTCAGDITVECSTHNGTPADDPQLTAFFAAASATDICDAAPDLEHDAPVLFLLGDTVVTWTATDDAGNEGNCSATVTVEDTTPPTIEVELNRYVLWPPNHKLVEIIATVAVEDICDPDPTFELTTIVSNEPDNGTGDGDFPNDIQEADFGTDDVTFLLRSERAGQGDGRIYTITYTGIDLSGNTTPIDVEVRVPHDRHGMAMASVGFDANGTGFEPGAHRYTIVIPTITEGATTPPGQAVDATRIAIENAAAGNTQGALPPVEHFYGDANSDGLTDLVLLYSVNATEIIAAQSEALDGPIALHYSVPVLDGSGNVVDHDDYLIADIFALGEPVTVEPASAGVEEPESGPAGSLPTVTRLARVFPNPFNPSTTVAFDLATGQNVQLRVYDARGALVRTLADGFLAAGRYEQRWDGIDHRGSQVGSGVYLVHFAAGSIRTSQKVVILK